MVGIIRILLLFKLIHITPNYTIINLKVLKLQHLSFVYIFMHVKVLNNIIESESNRSRY